MPDNIELVNMMRSVMQEELKPVHQEIQELRQDVQELRQGQQELKKGQAVIEAAVNDLRAINRATHKKIFVHLDAIWNDVKLIENRLNVQDGQEEEAVR